MYRIIERSVPVYDGSSVFQWKKNSSTDMEIDPLQIRPDSGPLGYISLLQCSPICVTSDIKTVTNMLKKKK